MMKKNISQELLYYLNFIRSTFMLQVLVNQFIMIGINTDNYILHVVETSRKKWSNILKTIVDFLNER